MRVTQHGPHLWQLTQYGFVNIYLVSEADGLTMIDTGLNGAQNGILRAANDLGRPITRIALTHAHGDHVGALDSTAALLPEAQVAMAPRTAEFLRGEPALRPDEVAAGAKLRGSFMRRATRPAQMLHPGDRLGSLRVVSAPGHTPDQIAFYDERDGALIAGDAFQTMGGVAVSGVIRPLFPLPAMATWSLPAAARTATELLALRPTRLAVGHGRVLDGPLPEMERAIRTAQKRVAA